MPRSAHTMVERSDNCKGGAFVKLNNMPRHVQPYGARTFQGKKGKLKRESHFLGTNVKCQQKNKTEPDSSPAAHGEKHKRTERSGQSASKVFSSISPVAVSIQGKKTNKTKDVSSQREEVLAFSASAASG